MNFLLLLNLGHQHWKYEYNLLMDFSEKNKYNELAVLTKWFNAT